MSALSVAREEREEGRAEGEEEGMKKGENNVIKVINMKYKGYNNNEIAKMLNINETIIIDILEKIDVPI